MKAVVFESTRRVAVHDVPDASVQEPTDALLRLTSSAPGAAGAAHGYAGMGPYPCVLAERLRVPFADANCVVLPGKPGDHLEDAFVLLADAFVTTGWHATELAGVTPGSSVAVFGAGTIRRVCRARPVGDVRRQPRWGAARALGQPVRQGCAGGSRSHARPPDLFGWS
jgi:hypothetical protein